MRPEKSQVFIAALAVFAWIITPASPSLADRMQHKDDPVLVDIAIKAREFQPSSATLPLGQEVLLVFRNEDVELHAFVPKKFLEDVPIHLDGNGAPQFGEHGLVRVLIPSGGRAELRFRLHRPGAYMYLCDLPGHQMVGHFLVE